MLRDKPGREPERPTTRVLKSGFCGCQSILRDPLQPFDGIYHIDVVDLIAESSAYDSEGLLCWIPKLSCFAAVDPEHGDVLTFSTVARSDIIRSPVRYAVARCLAG